MLERKLYQENAEEYGYVYTIKPNESIDDRYLKIEATAAVKRHGSYGVLITVKNGSADGINIGLYDDDFEALWLAMQAIQKEYDDARG